MGLKRSPQSGMGITEAVFPVCTADKDEQDLLQPHFFQYMQNLLAQICQFNWTTSLQTSSLDCIVHSFECCPGLVGWPRQFNNWTLDSGIVESYMKFLEVCIITLNYFNIHLLQKLNGFTAYGWVYLEWIVMIVQLCKHKIISMFSTVDAYCHSIKILCYLIPVNSYSDNTHWHCDEAARVTIKEQYVMVWVIVGGYNLNQAGVSTPQQWHHAGMLSGLAWPTIDCEPQLQYNLIPL